jgi:hypothetical protein
MKKYQSAKGGFLLKRLEGKRPSRGKRGIEKKLLLLFSQILSFIMPLVFLVGGAKEVYSQELADKHIPWPLVVNPDDDPGATPFHPTFDRYGTGPITCIWNTYLSTNDRIFSTSFTNGRRSRTRQLSAGPGVYYQQTFVSTGDNSGWLFWQQQSLGHWQIVGRQLNHGYWEPIVYLTPIQEDHVNPSATVVGDQVAITWENHNKNPQQIEMRVWDGNNWGPNQSISQPDLPAYRPALASTPDGELWAFWDIYNEKLYSIHGRQLTPDLSPIELISGTSRSNLKPTALFTGSSGLAVAWISVRDVIGGEGVLNQWNTIQLATRQNDQWVLSKSQEKTDIADLRHSLLPQIEPPGSTPGYQGHSRHPLLVEDQGDLWLLWERKILQDGASSLVPGELNGRKFDGRSWSDPVRVHEGLVEYTIPSSAKAENHRLTVIGMDTQLNYNLLNLDLTQGEDFQETQFLGWSPVELPLRDFGPRKSIELNGQNYKLYWGDLHVHTALTPDAEGEVDELMHFAMDKSKIDVVVMQENDAASWLNINPQGTHRGLNLPESNYRLGVYYSRKYTEPGRFVALPGWEWSGRREEGANHRTVIFADYDTPILRHTEYDDFERLSDVVEAAGGIMNTQHGTFWLKDRPADQGNIEVVSGWGNFIDPPDKIHADLSAGFKVGFVATSDGHLRNPGTGGGLTGIYATELTPEAILEALKNHFVYATNGNRMFIDARANGEFMGQDISVKEKVNFTLHVEAPEEILQAVLVRDGEEIYTKEGGGNTTLDVEYTDDPGKGFHWYYWRIEQEGSWPDYPGNMKVAEGHLGWSSPFRITVE